MCRKLAEIIQLDSSHCFQVEFEPLQMNNESIRQLLDATPFNCVYFGGALSTEIFVISFQNVTLHIQIK